MSGIELGFLKPAMPSRKEELARMTLKNIRSSGHTYVDLREDGKRFVFFCTLCLTPCYSETILFDHLRGSLHTRQFSSAKVTLMGPNPWPFDDGVFFFKNVDHHDHEKGKDVSGRVSGVDCCEYADDDDDLAIVVHNGASRVATDGHDEDESIKDLVIPGVLCKEKVCDLRVKLIGYGQISSRVCEKGGVDSNIKRLWCEWLGKKGDDEVNSVIPTLDFGIVTFVYYYELGKQGLYDEVKTLLLPSGEDNGKVDGSGKRRRRREKSFSDTDDVNETSSYQCDLSGEDFRGSSGTASALLLHQYDNQSLQSRIMYSKSLRRRLRRQQSVASTRTCDICQHKMLPGKDVATLLNLKTGRLACSSRNVIGGFHVFHTSCLVHWILLCELEMFINPPRQTKVRRRSKRVKSKFEEQEECETKLVGVKRNQSRKESNVGILRNQVCSVFCPNCQGTGLEIEGEELENPTVDLSQMFKYKIKLSDARKAWMKSPEKLENCSTGFNFSVQIDEDTQEKVAPMKLLHFYRPDEESWSQCS